MFAAAITIGRKIRIVGEDNGRDRNVKLRGMMLLHALVEIAGRDVARLHGEARLLVNVGGCSECRVGEGAASPAGGHGTTGPVVFMVGNALQEGVEQQARLRKPRALMLSAEGVDCRALFWADPEVEPHPVFLVACGIPLGQAEMLGAGIDACALLVPRKVQFAVHHAGGVDQRPHLAQPVILHEPWARGPPFEKAL